MIESVGDKTLRSLKSKRFDDRKYGGIMYSMKLSDHTDNAIIGNKMVNFVFMDKSVSDSHGFYDNKDVNLLFVDYKNDVLNRLLTINRIQIKDAIEKNVTHFHMNLDML